MNQGTTPLPDSNSLTWWCRTAVIVHSALALLVSLPATMIICANSLGFPFPSISADGFPAVMEAVEPIAHGIVQLATVILFSRAWWFLVRSSETRSGSSARATVVFVLLTQFILLVLRFVTESIRVSNIIHWEIDVFVNLQTYTFLYPGYFLLSLTPATAILWGIKRSPRIHAGVFRIVLVVGAFMLLLPIILGVIGQAAGLL